MSKLQEEFPFEVDSYFDMMKAITQIPVASEWEGVVKNHLLTAAKMANIIEAAPIDINTIELANVFIAGEE